MQIGSEKLARLLNSYWKMSRSIFSIFSLSENKFQFCLKVYFLLCIQPWWLGGKASAKFCSICRNDERCALFQIYLQDDKISKMYSLYTGW